MKNRSRPAVRSSTIGVDLIMISVTLIWGMNFAVMKGVYAHMHPFTLTLLRFVFAVLLLTPLLRWKKVNLRVERRDWPALAGLGLMSNTLYQILFVQGLARTRAGNAGLLMASTPIFAYAMGLFLKREAFNRRVLAGILLSAAGVAMIVLMGSRRISLGADWRGDGMVLAAAALWGWYSASTAGLILRYGSISVTYWLLVSGAAFMLPIMTPFALRQDWFAVPAAAWLGFFYSGLLSIVYCYLAWSYAIGRVGVSRTVVYSNVTPLVALLGGWLMLGEHPATLQFLGAALILAGVLLVRISAHPIRAGTES